MTCGAVPIQVDEMSDVYLVCLPSSLYQTIGVLGRANILTGIQQNPNSKSQEHKLTPRPINAASDLSTVAHNWSLAMAFGNCPICELGNGILDFTVLDLNLQDTAPDFAVNEVLEDHDRQLHRAKYAESEYCLENGLVYIAA